MKQSEIIRHIDNLKKILECNGIPNDVYEFMFSNLNNSCFVSFCFENKKITFQVKEEKERCTKKKVYSGQFVL